MALTWGNVRDRTLLIQEAQSYGAVKSTKTGKIRSVRLLAALSADLAEWRLASGRPPADALVFPARNGTVWSDHDYRNWRKRVFQPTARQAQATRRPYDLRHTFCSLLLYEGQTAVEVAEQVGNSATMIYDTYAHVIAEAKGGERLSAEAQIKAARERGVSEKCPPKSAEASSIAANRL